MALIMFSTDSHLNVLRSSQDQSLDAKATHEVHLNKVLVVINEVRNHLQALLIEIIENAEMKEINVKWKKKRGN